MSTSTTNVLRYCHQKVRYSCKRQKLNIFCIFFFKEQSTESEMPRTKAVKKKPAEQSKLAQGWLEYIEICRKAEVSALENHIEAVTSMVRSHLLQAKLNIPQSMISKTLGELTELPLNWSGNSTSASVLQVLNATKSLTVKKKKTVSRSSSCGDEGYLTTESSKSTSGGRTSRSRSRVQKPRHTSRSASNHNRTTRNVAQPVDRYRTPANRIPPSTYGTVTPKIKPNTPQVLLRRPKLGEVALSMQGSPLLTGAVLADNVANINIPLNDGRLLSIQPQRGLRISEIPQLDLETKRQLETLRDNLNKVCALSSRR